MTGTYKTAMEARTVATVRNVRVRESASNTKVSYPPVTDGSLFTLKTPTLATIQLNRYNDQMTTIAKYTSKCCPNAKYTPKSAHMPM